ncbi:hypothetical protein LDDCCGHA_3399 [Methylobacterium oxalidis]|nr:hypothetical protein LDDCCGHA_3399 [Methylobacterium oxalidis]
MLVTITIGTVASAGTERIAVMKATPFMPGMS